MARTYAAALTPLRNGGAELDEDAFAPYVDFLHRGGVVGVLGLGTTGEGILLGRDEGMRVAELFMDGPLEVIVNCGAQTTLATAQLAAHAAEQQAAGVAVIAPPYFQLDEQALLAHFTAAAHACDPLPFYVYEFARASGYAVPVEVVERLRDEAPNLAGLKVSDAPFESFSPYLIEGLDVFVGPEALIGRGIESGAVGAVSALATAFPEIVAEAVRKPGSDAAEKVGELRAAVERFPRHAALKRVLGLRGVPIREDVRRPLRPLADDERAELDRLLPAWLEPALAV
jgi:dihydrodipicolinate synthase/N-acetylneuraminate lyase